MLRWMRRWIEYRRQYNQMLAETEAYYARRHYNNYIRPRELMASLKSDGHDNASGGSFRNHSLLLNGPCVVRYEFDEPITLLPGDSARITFTETFE